MIRMTTNDGLAIEAPTYENAVSQLRKAAKWIPTTDNQEFMKGAARRARVWNGAEVTYSTEREFILTLADSGLVTIESMEEEDTK